jgi:hypothetical protein
MIILYIIEVFLMRKKLSLLILSVVLSLVLASCGKAEITYAFYVFQSGEIYQTIEVKIDEESLDVMGYDAKIICLITKLIFESADYYAEIVEGENIVYAERYFESRTDWNIYYGISGDEAPDEYDENFYKVGGVFFDEYISKGASPFGDIEEIIASVVDSEILEAIGAAREYDAAVIAMIRDDLIELDYTLFTYVYRYSTYLDSVKFKDADEAGFDEETGLNSFTFFMNHETKGRIIESSQRVPNIEAWFLTAAGAAVLVVLAVYGIGLFVERGKAKIRLEK